MKFICPNCGHELSTEDLNIYTCVNCDEIFTTDELTLEYDLESSCTACQINNN